VIVYLLTFCVLSLYFLPWLIACHREHRNRLAIFVLNCFAGWTLIGWIAALVWASTDNVE
jgi:hypothetical protein